MASHDRLKELAKHLRGRLRHEGIAARCRVCPAGGSIQVFVIRHGLEFSHADQRTIRIIAKVNGLTRVRGIEIDIDRMTDPHHFEFYLLAASEIAAA